MARLRGATAGGIADAFTAYLFRRYAKRRHVRRVTPWIGLIVLGIEQVKDGDWEVPRVRQLSFRMKNRELIAEYKHAVKPKGGIVIRERKKAQPIVTIASLSDARDFYENPRAGLGGRRS